MTDWLPTLLSAAGVYPKLKVDGVDQWPAIAFDLNSGRKEVLLNINTVTGVGAIIKDGWKLVKGVETVDHNEWLTGQNQLHLNENEYYDRVVGSDVHKSLGFLRRDDVEELTEKASIFCGPLPMSPVFQCKPTELCLFNIAEDKCEYYNIAKLYPQKVKELSVSLLQYAKTTKMALNRPLDRNCNPAAYNNTWTYWGDLGQAQYHGLAMLKLPQTMNQLYLDSSKY